MKGKLFLVAMLVIGLVVGMAALGFVGCETDTTSASTPNNGRTIVLRGVTPSKYVSVKVFMTGANIYTTAPIGYGDLIGAALSAAISGNDVAIDVQPSNGSFLAEIPYQVTVEVDDYTLRYTPSRYFESSRVDIVWTELADPPDYGISITPSGSHIFKPSDAPLPIVITNKNATQATGPLTVTVSDPDLFTLSTTQNASGIPESSSTSITVASLVPSGTGAFSVQPKRPLGTNESLYAALIEVSGGTDISDSLFAICTENESIAGGNDISIGISLSNNDDGKALDKGYTFTSVTETLSVDVENTGDTATGPLTVTFFGPVSGSFKADKQEIGSIAKDGVTKNAFTVQPDSKLAESTYATVMVSGDAAHNIIGAFRVSFTASAVPTEKTATTPADVTWGDSIEKVTYTGTEALGTISIPDGKKLTITGTVDGSNAITVENGAALEIAKDASIGGTITIAAAEGESKAGTVTNDGTIDLGASGTITKNGGTVTNNGTIRTASDISLVTAGGTGTIVLTGTATATADIALTQKLEIASTTGILNLGTYTISPIGPTGKLTNNGTITTAATGVTALNAILAAKGKITASGQVRVDDNLEILQGATLTITNRLTISGAKLTVTGTLALPDSATFVNSNGTIEAANVQALVNVLGLPIYGTVTLKPTGEVTLYSPYPDNPILIVIREDVMLTVNAEQTLKVSENATLTVGGGGKLTGPGSLVVDDYGSVEVGATGDVTVTGSSSGLIDVTAKYELPTGTESRTSFDGKTVDTPKNYLDNNAPLISLAAKKDLATKIVTISLTGTVADSMVGNFKVVDLWFGLDSTHSTTTGNFAIATIKGLFDSVKTQAKLLKNYNPSWAYYNGTSFSTIQPEYPIEAPTTASDNFLWLGDDDGYPEAFNWSRREGSSDNPDDDELTLLLWSEAPAANQKARLEVTAPPDASTSPTYTVIVDWSGLEIK